VLKLQSEADQLKIQELEDRRRIQHLLALTAPVTQEVTFFRDCRPEALTRYPIESRGGPGGAAASGSALISSASDTRGSTGSANSRVLRTVYLPSERTDALLLKCQALQRQLDAENELNRKRTEAWRADKDAREATFRRKADSDTARIATLERDLESAQLRLREATADYLNHRHSAQVEGRALHESNTALGKEIEEVRVVGREGTVVRWREKSKEGGEGRGARGREAQLLCQYLVSAFMYVCR
jgi:coiled-coil domain-containing protein 77